MRQPFSYPGSDWRRTFRGAVMDRLPLKVASVLLAVVLWFIVGAREPTEEVASVLFRPQLDSALVLRDPPPPIRAHVLGRPSEILKLANTPLTIRRTITGDVPDTLAIPIRTTDVSVPDGVEVIVREVYPQAVTLVFEPTAARILPVTSQLWIQAPIGSPRYLVRLDPESVLVRGPRRILARLASVRTVPDSLPVDTISQLVDLDTAGLGVSVRPSQVKARLVRSPL